MQPLPETTMPRPTPEQLADAALAAWNLHNYLAEPGAPLMFDDLALSATQRRYLLALADVGAFYVEHRARLAAAGKAGGQAKTRRKVRASQRNGRKSRGPVRKAA